MEQIHDRVAGLDVHRDSVAVCVRVTGPRGGAGVEKERFATTTAALARLREWLADRQVSLVVMEATGVYWKPVFYALEDSFEVWLCNAQHVKNVPGRKTDMSDAEWLADVAAHGMVRPSFVPPLAIRELRELTRYRKTQIDARVAEIQRLEKLLQDAGIKLTSVASKVLTQSGRLMVEALIAGQRDPAALAQLAKGKLRPKIPAVDRGAGRALRRASRGGRRAGAGPHRLPGCQHRGVDRADRHPDAALRGCADAAGADPGLRSAGHRYGDPGGVPHLVVDALEVVDVQHGQGGDPGVPLGALSSPSPSSKKCRRSKAPVSSSVVASLRRRSSSSFCAVSSTNPAIRTGSPSRSKNLPVHHRPEGAPAAGAEPGREPGLPAPLGGGARRTPGDRRDRK